jgi:hypothetical protein
VLQCWRSWLLSLQPGAFAVLGQPVSSIVTDQSVSKSHHGDFVKQAEARIPRYITQSCMQCCFTCPTITDAFGGPMRRIHQPAPRIMGGTEATAYLGSVARLGECSIL